MNIGIVSKPAHCKSHKKALVEMGFRVRVLGGNPNTIPDSLDLLVVRVASISHGAEKTARMWGKTKNRPTVYENGISGIRREINRLGLAPLSGLPPTEIQTIREETMNTPTTPTTPVVPRGIFTLDAPDGEPNWYNRFNTRKFVDIFSEVWDSIQEKVDTDSEEFRSFIEKAKSLTLIEAESEFDVDAYTDHLAPYFDFDGEPYLALSYFYMFAAEGFCPYIRDVSRFYSLMTGSSLSSYNAKGVAWHMGFPIPTNAPRWANTPAPAPAPAPEPETSSISDTVESNTEAILTLMEDFSTFKNEIRADVAQIGAGLESRIKELEERVTQVRLDQIPDSDLGSRIKALELGASETLRQAQTGARQAVEEMREELRSDISNAFDALAAEQPSGDVSSNPLAALEQVKAALKTAGFKGTLTLTIE